MPWKHQILRTINRLVSVAETYVIPVRRELSSYIAENGIVTAVKTSNLPCSLAV
jgi:hypothetical protein